MVHGVFKKDSPMRLNQIRKKKFTSPNIFIPAKMGFKLEIIGFNIESCAIAQAAGADRIELCDNPAEGGTTASFGFIKAARKLLHIDLYPIIRPRGGDFLFSEEEFDIMKADVQLCKEIGCNGVVIGMLNPDGSIDKKRSGKLVEIAYPLGVTFHRAFDRCADPFAALKDVIDIGCERILTSGLQNAATDAAALLAGLVKEANEDIIIMPGSGVRSSNIISLAKETGATQFHSSARKMIGSAMNYHNQDINESLEHTIADAEEISKLKALLSQYFIEK